MAKLSEMKAYLYRRIEDYGGTTSPDYKTFERKYRNYIKKVASENDGELVKFNPSHYEFSCFVRRNGKYVYISISDVRYWHNQWYNNILIRTAQNDKDYRGGSNNYCSLDELGMFFPLVFLEGFVKNQC